MTNAHSKPVHPYSATVAKAREEAVARGDEYYTITAGVDQLNCIAAEAVAQGDEVVEVEEECPQLVDTSQTQTNNQHNYTTGPALQNFNDILLQLGSIAQQLPPTVAPSTPIISPELAFASIVAVYHECNQLVVKGTSAAAINKLTAMMMFVWERNFGPIFQAGLRTSRIKTTTAVLAMVTAALIVSVWRL
jgi:hypothetical protein